MSTGFPDLVLLGAPKAGTSALHAALARHPEVYASPVKEPKYYLCGDAPPPAYCGPGDAHSQQEWIWRRADYVQQFAGARPDQRRMESTPFYLYSPDARRRIAADLPDARFVAVIRDPVDRAYSNWMHLWVDGLEPEADFAAGWADEDRRVAAGWAPFWHYRRLGRYGEQLAALFELVDRDRVLVLRYRELLDEPAATLDRVCRFAGLTPGRVDRLPADNSRGFVGSGAHVALSGRALRLGAAAAQFVPPQIWRRASRPLLDWRRLGGPDHRPTLDPTVRAAMVEAFREDVGLLETLLGRSFADWLAPVGAGSYKQRVAAG